MYIFANLLTLKRRKTTTQAITSNSSQLSPFVNVECNGSFLASLNHHYGVFCFVIFKNIYLLHLSCMYISSFFQSELFFLLNSTFMLELRKKFKLLDLLISFAFLYVGGQRCKICNTVTTHYSPLFTK